MKSADAKAHDILLLTLELSKISDHRHIIESFMNGFHEIWSDVHGRFIKERCGDDPGHLPVESSGTYFGCLTVDGFVELNKQDQSLIRNAAEMLGVVLKKQEQEKLLSSRKSFYENVMENVQDGIWITDKNDAIFYVNRGMETIAGVPKEKIIDKNVFEDFPKETTEKFNVFYRKAKKELKPTWYEVTVKTPAGVDTWQNGWLVPVLTDGRFDGIICTVRDVSERKLAEEELRKQKDIFELVINSVPIRIFWKDRNSVYLGCNNAFAEVSGCGEIENLIGKNDFNLVWGWEAKKYIDDDRQVMETGNPKIGYEETYIDHEGNTVWWRTSKMPLKNNDGEIFGVICTSEDITNRKVVEKTLKENELKFRLVTETIEDVFWMSTCGVGKMVYISPAYERLWQKSIEDLYKSPRSFLDSIHPDDLKSYLDIIDIYHKNGKSYECEYRIIRKNKEIRWICERGYPLSHSLDDTQLMTGVCTDITERKQAANTIIQSQRRYQSLFDNSPIPIWEEDFSEVKKYIDSLKKRRVKDFRTYFENRPDKVRECVGLVRIIDVNDAVLKLHEAESKDEFDTGLFSIFVEESYEVFKKQLITIAEGKSECELEGTVATVRGKKKVISFKWLVVPGYEDTLKKVYISTTDITALMHAQEELRETLLRQNEAVRAGNIGIWDWDLDTNEVQFSREWKSQIGYGEDEVSDEFEEWRSRVHPDDLQRAEESVQRSIQEGNPKHEAEFRFRHKDGSYRWILTRASVIRNEEGRAVRMLGSHVDITERKRIEFQVQQKLRENETLLRELYHRTKNNLQVVSSMLSIRSRSCGDPRISEEFNEVNGKVRAIGLVHEKLYQSQNLSRLNLREYITELAGLMKHTFGKQASSILFIYELEDLTINVDMAAPLGLVINELVSNALKHAFPNSRKGTVHLRLYLDKIKKINLEIIDSGVGLKPETDLRKCTSMGLQLMFKLVEHQLQGTVEYQSHDGLRWHIVLNDKNFNPRV